MSMIAHLQRLELTGVVSLMASVHVYPVISSFGVLELHLLSKQAHESGERERVNDAEFPARERQVVRDAYMALAASRGRHQVEMIDTHQRSALGAQVL
jgi:hypothetical protein